MTTQEKIDILKTHFLFQDLPYKELEDVAEKAKEKFFSPRTLIIDQSIVVDHVYLIYKGLVEIYFLTNDGKIIPIRVKEPPYVVGELNLFDDYSVGSVEAMQECHTLMITMNDFRGLILKHSTFGLNVLRIVIEKLRAANHETINYATKSLKDRTWKFLEIMGTHYPNKEIPFSQEELSIVVGATRARVTEILNEFEEKKMILLSHRKIKVL